MKTLVLERLIICNYCIMQTSRIIAKLACWGRDKMDGADLQYYLNWLKEQLRIPVTIVALFIHSVSSQYKNTCIVVTYLIAAESLM